MTRRTLVLALAVAVVLAGCTVGPGAPTESSPATDATPAGDEPGDATTNGTTAAPPGVVGGRLANATALLAAHRTALSDDGFAANASRTVDGERAEQYRVVSSPGFATYALTGERSAGESETVSTDLWANESTRFVRLRADGETDYRSSPRRGDSLYVVERPGDYLRVGDFAVADGEAARDDRVVLVADEYAPPADRRGPFEGVDSFEGRAVVDERGRIHQFEMTADTDRGTVGYSFALESIEGERVDRPTWVAEIPASVALSPRLSVDVTDDGALTVRNEGGDAVPAGATLDVTSNGTSYRATFEERLPAGDVRYASVSESDGRLDLADERPAPETVAPLSSPISVSVETADGVSLYSAGMAWESASASEGSGGSSSGSSGSSGGSSETAST